MASLDMTCESVDERDLDTRYIAGTLAPEDAEAFEEHYFACDRCWGLVQQGLAIRSAADDPAASESTGVAAVTEPGVIAISPPVASRRLPRRRNAWRVSVLAAAVVLIAIGVERVASRGQPRLADVERGTQLSLPVTASRPTADSLVASWPRVAGAVRYHSRLYTSSGTLLAERTTADTTIAQAARRLPHWNSAGNPSATDSLRRLFWNVEALDARGTVIAKSPLTPVIGSR